MIYPAVAVISTAIVTQRYGFIGRSIARVESNCIVRCECALLAGSIHSRRYPAAHMHKCLLSSCADMSAEAA